MPENRPYVRSPLLGATVVLVVGLGGCTDGGDAGSPGATATATATATVTSTVTETVTAVPEPALTDAPLLLESRDEEPPHLRLEVFRDGCGVIRTEADPGVTYQNLQWTVTDGDGFDVLGRNAEGETHMRYFQGGAYSVVLESFWDGAYRPVSNEVQISC